jgi:hypothetical protein
MKPVPDAVCPEADCEVRKVRRWFRHNRGCTRSACPKSFADCFLRLEQKQVDIHLALDFIVLAQQLPDSACLALASDDTDLLPAVVAASSRGKPDPHLSLLRFNEKKTYMDDFILERGVNILTLPPLPPTRLAIAG